MHIVHYVLGLYFYTAVGPTALLHLNSGVIIEDILQHINFKFCMGVLEYG